ncbi:MAG: VOC family protein [Anaerolineaceae bacterium]|nr:MAG: VOC family protein [Anaerolineaceae bacterium]
MSEHPIVHIELSADDPKAAGKFYGDVFGWDIQLLSEMDYVTFGAEPGPGGGFNEVDNEMHQAGDVLIYIHTGNIETTLKKIEALGGQTVLQKTEIPTIGWFALFSDPTGNRVGLFTGMESQT